MGKLWILFLITASVLFGCAAPADPAAAASSRLGIDLSGCPVLESSDSHGGFLGDGTTYLRFRMADAPEALEQITSGWKKLPLTENLAAAVYGFSADEYTRQSLLRDETGAVLLPEVTNGYYWFYDRQGETHNDSALISRPSCNFTLAIYDVDTGILHYVELDT